MRLFRFGVPLAVGVALALGACGGEDRPGEVTTESGTGTGSHTGSGTGSHTGSGAGPAFAEGEQDASVEVVMTDYAFAMPATVTGAKVLFSVRNDGPGEHEFEVLAADGDEVGEIPAFAKGATKTLALKLEPGAYTVRCLVKEGARTHAELGMETRFTVA